MATSATICSCFCSYFCEWFEIRNKTKKINKALTNNADHPYTCVIWDNRRYNKWETVLMCYNYVHSKIFGQSEPHCSNKKVVLIAKEHECENKCLFSSMERKELKELNNDVYVHCR